MQNKFREEIERMNYLHIKYRDNKCRNGYNELIVFIITDQINIQN